MSLGRIVLASRSQRRRMLLEEAGFTVDINVPPIDDNDAYVQQQSPQHLVISLAWFKASQITCDLHGAVALVAADTICDLDGEVIGKPKSQDDAGEMLARMFGRAHITRTGVCVLSKHGRMLFEDATVVRMGVPNEAQVSEYLLSGSWEGKAGGYNLSERIDAGWPIEFEGDPTTVMGLPMQRLCPLLMELANQDG